MKSRKPVKRRTDEERLADLKEKKVALREEYIVADRKVDAKIEALDIKLAPRKKAKEEKIVMDTAAKEIADIKKEMIDSMDL